VLLLGLALVAAAGIGATKMRTTSRPAAKSTASHRIPVTCGHRAAAFREKLEPVVEAAIDRRPKRAATAADSALAWWHRHSGSFGTQATADSLLPAMQAAAHARRPLHAARLAVLVSDQSFVWCPEPPTMADQLMRIDLVGQTGWLRAHNIDLPWPDGARDAVRVVTAALRGKQRSALADSLEAYVAATLKTPVAAHRDAAPSQTLLDLVDVAEKEIP